jgi:hypothetical protein
MDSLNWNVNTQRRVHIFLQALRGEEDDFSDFPQVHSLEVKLELD